MFNLRFNYIVLLIAMAAAFGISAIANAEVPVISHLGPDFGPPGIVVGIFPATSTCWVEDPVLGRCSFGEMMDGDEVQMCQVTEESCIWQPVPIYSWSKYLVRFKVPGWMFDSDTIARVRIHKQGVGDSNFKEFSIRAHPWINSLSPDFGIYGTDVTVNGLGFGIAKEIIYPPSEYGCSTYVELASQTKKYRATDYSSTWDPHRITFKLNSLLDTNTGQPVLQENLEKGCWHVTVVTDYFIDDGDGLYNHGMAGLDSDDLLLYRDVSDPVCLTVNDLSVYPPKGGNAGQVTVKISGGGFAEGTTAKLARDATEIVGLNTQILDNDGMNTTFDLTGATLGLWNLIVTFPDTTQLTCQDCFTVEQGGEAKLWVEIVGQYQMRVGREETYSIVYGNSGNVDSPQATILISVPSSVRAVLTKETIENLLIYEPPVPLADGSEIIVLEVYVNRVQAGGRGVIHCKLLADDFVGIALRAVIVLDELLFGSKTAFIDDGLFRPAHIEASSNQAPTIKVEIIDAKGVEANQKEYEVRHPYFVMDDGVYTQVGNSDKRKMIKMTFQEFNDYKKQWEQDLHSEGNVLYLKYGGKFVVGEKEVTQKQLDAFKQKLNDARGKLTSEDCMLQPDRLAEEAGIPDGFIPESLENQEYFHGDGFCKTFGISDDELNSLPNGLIGRKGPLGQFFDKPKIVFGFENPWTLNIEVVTSIDPNDKAGPAGFDLGGAPADQLKHFVTNDHSLGYMVFFENLEAATAAAQEVLITDQLDSNLDWTTFSFSTMQVGEKVTTVPEDLKNFQTTIDLRPDIPALVDIDCNLMLATGVFECLFRGKDPDTGEIGDFLPPNTETVDPKGKGWISYNVKPKSNLPTGTVIRNRATIDFEVGIPPEPMDTPEVFNTIDSGTPTSSVLPLSATQTAPNFVVSWNGSDDTGGSGIRNYDIYVSNNGGTYTLWLTTAETSANFTGENGHQYSFYSRARDNVGNVEEAPLGADTITTITGAQYVRLILPNGGDVLPSGGTYAICWGAPSNAVKFDLKYSTNNGTSWNFIKSVTGLNCTHWEEVPVVTANKKQCRMKVIGYDSNGVKVGEDISDKTFTIEVLRITSPNGGETLKSGSAWSIRWVTNKTIRPVAKTVLKYTTDGTTWKAIKTLSGNPGNYSWTVPNVSSSKCKVKVILKDASGITVGSDVSDKVFTIQP
jgi:hypothetical protein